MNEHFQYEFNSDRAFDNKRNALKVPLLQHWIAIVCFVILKFRKESLGFSNEECFVRYQLCSH